MNQASFFEQCVKKMQNSITSDPSNGSKSLWPRFLLKIYSIREVIIYLSHSGQFNLTPAMKKHHRDLVAMRTFGLSDFPGNCFLLPLSESIFYFLKSETNATNYDKWQKTIKAARLRQKAEYLRDKKMCQFILPGQKIRFLGKIFSLPVDFNQCFFLSLPVFFRAKFLFFWPIFCGKYYQI